VIREEADTARLLRRLARGLEKRDALHSGAAREGLDVHLLELVDRLRSLAQQTFAEEPGEAPPRSVAVPLALALFCQPHLDITFGSPRWIATEDLIPPDLLQANPPMVFAPEALKSAVALEEWETEELREEGDRRVGTVLRQARAVEWLWQRFDMASADPEILFRALFPAAPSKIDGPIGFARYGAHLYAIVDQTPPPPRSSLFLGWVQPDGESVFAPLATFDARYIDPGLRRALGRAIGATESEVLDLLDRMVTVVPRKGCSAWIAHDQWRIMGLAAMTGLGVSYTSAGWLVRPLAPNDLYVKDFIELSGGTLVARKPEAAFDAYATERATTMLNHVYAEMLARLVREDTQTPPTATVEDLSLYDVTRHLRRVLRPLIDWVRAPDTVSHVARVFSVTEAEARTVIATVAAAWEDRGQKRWWGATAQDEPESAASILLLHLVSSHGALRHAFRRSTSSRRPHRDVLLLFAAHYYAEASVGRLLREGGRVGHDPVARWFWTQWSALSTQPEDEESTWTGPQTPAS